MTWLPTRTGAPGYPGSRELALAGDRVAVDGVGGPQPLAVLQHPLGDEPHGRVEEVVGAGDGRGLTGVGLVPDPGVAVVVVTALLGALGSEVVAAATMPRSLLVRPRSTA